MRWTPPRARLSPPSPLTTRRLSAALVSIGIIASTLGVLAVLLTRPSEPAQALVLVLALGTLVAGLVTRPLLTGVVLAGMFCVVASWDQVAVAGVNARMALLLPAALLLGIGYGLRHMPPVPWWLHAYGLSALVSTLLVTHFPIAESYLSDRYATSVAGTSLGTRPGNLPSILSLLFNNYAVPITIVLACMYLPRALRWLLAAYVVGAALSCFGAALGYYGYPWLVDAMNGLPTPEGGRASGFTNHPLRLATSAVMSLAFSCWLAVQRQLALRLCGAACIPLLMLGLYVSGSRGGFVAGVLSATLCIFLLPEVRSRLHVAAGAIGLGFALVVIFVPSALDAVLKNTRVLGDTTTVTSDTGRAELFEQGIHDFLESPVYGIGIRFIAEAHVLYLGVLASGGLIFMVGFLLFNIGSIRMAMETTRGAYDSLGSALVATLIATLFYWTVADLIQTATVAAVFGFLIAAWWCSLPSSDDQDDQDQTAAVRPADV